MIHFNLFRLEPLKGLRFRFPQNFLVIAREELRQRLFEEYVRQTQSHKVKDTVLDVEEFQLGGKDALFKDEHKDQEKDLIFEKGNQVESMLDQVDEVEADHKGNEGGDDLLVFLIQLQQHHARLEHVGLEEAIENQN